MNSQAKSPQNKKNKRPIAALALVLGLLGPISASAQQPGPGFGDHAGMPRFEGGALRGMPHGLWWKNSALIQQIGITPEQQKKMDDILQQHRLQLIDLKANVERQQVLLEPMLDANPPDTPQVLAQIDKLVQARADLEKTNARMLLGIRTVLTPDQWTKLRAHRAEMFHDRMRMDGDNSFHGHRPDGQGPGGQRGPGTPPPPPPPPSE
jgi:Spy/CpxP family protein refolding chaperone